jgi:hypothetical protein
VCARLQEGDSVMYSRFAGTKLKIGEDEHIIMKESDVLGTKGATMADLKPTEVRSCQGGRTTALTRSSRQALHSGTALRHSTQALHSGSRSRYARLACSRSSAWNPARAEQRMHARPERPGRSGMCRGAAVYDKGCGGGQGAHACCSVELAE